MWEAGEIEDSSSSDDEGGPGGAGGAQAGPSRAPRHRVERPTTRETKGKGDRQRERMLTELAMSPEMIDKRMTRASSKRALEERAKEREEIPRGRIHSLLRRRKLVMEEEEDREEVPQEQAVPQEQDVPVPVEEEQGHESDQERAEEEPRGLVDYSSNDQDT